MGKKKKSKNQRRNKASALAAPSCTPQKRSLSASNSYAGLDKPNKKVKSTPNQNQNQTQNQNINQKLNHNATKSPENQAKSGFTAVQAVRKGFSTIVGPSKQGTNGFAAVNKTTVTAANDFKSQGGKAIIALKKSVSTPQLSTPDKHGKVEFTLNKANAAPENKIKSGADKVSSPHTRAKIHSSPRTPLLSPRHVEEKAKLSVKVILNPILTGGG
jgi:hypothetical protein